MSRKEVEDWGGKQEKGESKKCHVQVQITWINKNFIYISKMKILKFLQFLPCCPGTQLLTHKLLRDKPDPNPEQEQKSVSSFKGLGENLTSTDSQENVKGGELTPYYDGGGGGSYTTSCIFQSNKLKE